MARATDIDVVFAIWTDDIDVGHVGCGGLDGQWWPFMGDNAATIGHALTGIGPTELDNTDLTEQAADNNPVRKRPRHVLRVDSLFLADRRQETPGRK